MFSLLFSVILLLMLNFG